MACSGESFDSLGRIESAVRVVLTLGILLFPDFISVLLCIEGGGLIDGSQHFAQKLHVAARPTFMLVGAGWD